MNGKVQVPQAGTHRAQPPRPRPSRRRLLWIVLPVLLFVVVCLPTLLLLINAEENWRAGRLWQRCRQELEARGEKLDVKDFLPAPIPADQNFAATPLLAAALARNDSKNPVDLRLDRKQNPPPTGSWRLGNHTDWQAWCDYYRRRPDSPASPPQAPVATVLAALGQLDPQLAELRAAAARPQARFPVPLDTDLPGMLVPYLPLAKGIAQTMALHATAEVTVGRGAEALSDLKVNWRLLEALKSEPVLITFLVRVSIHEITLQPVWEGLAARAWDEPQLAALDQELGRLDFLAESAQALRGERAFMNATFEQLWQQPPRARPGPNPAEVGPESSGGLPPLVRILFPRWMVYRNQALAARLVQDMIDHLDNAWQRPETTSALDMSYTNRWAREFRRTSPNNALAKLLLPALSTCPPKAVRSQTTLTLARTACALERYRLAQGAYPERLERLVPQYLPKVPLDLFAGKPLHYRLQPDGRFLLYSIGANQTDDGGRVEKPSSTTSPRRYRSTVSDKDSVALDQGDWVWGYP